MKCSFCDNPAAHPATGCQYGLNTLACYYCVVACWKWVKQHTNGKNRRKGLSFYEAAGRHKVAQ